MIIYTVFDPTRQPAPCRRRDVDGGGAGVRHTFNVARVHYRLAGRAIAILKAWSANLKKIGGSSDNYLASGIYGYELANAAEILRTSPQWQAADFQRFQSMMLTVFYPLNDDFLTKHNGTKVDHYWANWDLANMASLLEIGVLTDRWDGKLTQFDERVGMASRIVPPNRLYLRYT